MQEIDRVIHLRSAEWMVYARSSLVQETLATSNREFERLVDVHQYINDQDRAWRARQLGTLTALMQRLQSNDLALDLQATLARLETDNGFPVFAEVFLTNRFGANVAQTNRTSDYRQDDEQWWQLAKRDAVHVGDVGFDESAGVFSTDVCIRIEDDHGAFLGVLKAVLNIEEVIRIIDSHSLNLGETGRSRIVLCTADKRIIHIGNNPGQFRLEIVPLPEQWVRPFRLTLDEQEDLDMFNALYQKIRFDEVGASIDEVFAVLDANPEIPAMNSEITLKYEVDQDLIKLLKEKTTLNPDSEDSD